MNYNMQMAFIAAQVPLRSGYFAPPTPIWVLINRCGFAVNKKKMKKAACALIVAENSIQFELDEKQKHWQQRFSAAHLLGHVLLHKPAKGIYTHYDFVGSNAETEANRFAADVLCPLDVLAEYVKSYNFDCNALAALFQLSFTMMDIRMEQLRGHTVCDSLY